MREGSFRWSGLFPKKTKRTAAKKRQKQKCVQRWRPTLEALETRMVLASSLDTAISGTIINDVNANGVKDGGEDGLVDWVVYLDANLNGNFDSGERFEVTNVDGDYLFQGLETGTHRVRQVIPSGWTSTGPEYVDLTLQLDQEKKARFFDVFTGSAGIGSISGAVWNDLDGDGARAVDPETGLYSEPGVSGLTVYLDLNNDNVFSGGDLSTVTDTEGLYSFASLQVGDYDVRLVLPSGWEATRGYNTNEIVTVFADSDTPLDFGVDLSQASVIQGTVWSDLDGDGIRATDPETGAYIEPGIAGIQVFVDDNEDGFYSIGEPTAFSDGNGLYTITNVPHGNVEVIVLPASNFLPTSPGSGLYLFDLLNGQAVTDVDFGLHELQPAVISGTLWNDLDGDSIRATDPMTGEFTEPGLAGYVVFLDSNLDGLLSVDETWTLTDANGRYTFAGLSAGEYAVVEVLPSGWEAAPGYATSQIVWAELDTVTTVDFGNFLTLPVTVQGIVWIDLDGNGIRDVDAATGEFTEPGVAGWTIFVDANSDGLLNEGELSAVSAVDGLYTISGVHHGFASIRQIPHAGWNPTSPVSGAYTLTLLNGQTMTGIDFGNYPRQEASIRGTVYMDADKDGVRDAGERGLSGITVYLDLNDNGILDASEPNVLTSSDLFFTPSVDETGTYSFTHLAAGTYRVREIVPGDQLPTPESQSSHLVTVSIGEDVTGIDSGNIYRPNEIHGVKFNDFDGDHVRDDDETGIAGVTIYVDLDRDDIFDEGEPITVTAADGSYSFVDLTPGAYVIRDVDQNGYAQTYPGTLGGTLWPDGQSNPASGNVTPSEIVVSLADQQSYQQNVSITLPGSGGITNMVDVFLLFDDTGSFVNNSPIVRAAFPQIIASLQTALPGIDFGFGVGRFEEYGNFADEYSTGRPFILNQPILAQSTAGFQTSIQAALDRVAPGYGGDTPETLIEALYQTVTGLGFDGNNNGTVSDSGAAGLSSTQVTPGNSGDVPAFSSFTVDPAHSVLAPSGTVGGVGFRAGALPIILAATDTGFAYQPNGETFITGVGGLTLPISALTQSARTTTPFANGAGIQETITALNALGALVIGLGVNSELNLDPRQDLEAIARLTGAVNNSTSTIANGTIDAVAPGDPFYFLISSGFGGTVASGIVNAIQNAATNVAMNITVRASDPTVHLINHTGTVLNVGAGQTASFDVEFVGDGRPHRFDLQFVREGTNVVLGSIPVVIGTPIPGDGYEYEDLDDGEIGEDVDFGCSAEDFHPSMAGPTHASRDQQVTFVLGVTGPTILAGDTIDFSIDWNGDGSEIETLSGHAGMSVTHTFATVGTRSIRLFATDHNDSVTGRIVVGFDVSAVQLAENANDPNLMDLVWTGTAGADHVRFEHVDATTVRVVTLADGNAIVNHSEVITGVTGAVIAKGLAGSDELDASGLSSITAILYGGDNQDTLRGGDANDKLYGDSDGGEGTGDVIFGNGGDDLIFGDGNVGKKTASDTIHGGLGNDTIYGDSDGGEAAADLIYGDEGNDSIYADGPKGGKSAKDTIFGGDGDDQITADGAEGANDEIVGGAGNDLIDTGGGNDIADGGLGDDILLGGDGAEGASDTLQGSDGRDILVGDRGTATVKSTSAGADSLLGGAGEDLVLASIYIPASTSAIVSIQSEWVSTRTYAERVANITGTGTGDRNNGDDFLVPGGNVTNDRVGSLAVIDSVFGGDDQDWLLGDAAEDVTDIAIDEILTDL
ncbi:MAG: SdrD B-like domain-containing protein [Planctomycetota bacterium]